MKLEKPQKKHKEMYLLLLKDWKNIEESPWALFKWNNFDDFLLETKNFAINSPTGVNSDLFFLINWEKILWAIDIRHSINSKRLIESWWHIWYWIAPKFRKKWYATKMLELALIEAKKIWLKKVLITCNLDNIGSIKVIEKNWGIFERFTKDWKMNRFWIEL